MSFIYNNLCKTFDARYPLRVTFLHRKISSLRGRCYWLALVSFGINIELSISAEPCVGQVEQAHPNTGPRRGEWHNVVSAGGPSRESHTVAAPVANYAWVSEPVAHEELLPSLGNTAIHLHRIPLARDPESRPRPSRPAPLDTQTINPRTLPFEKWTRAGERDRNAKRPVESDDSRKSQPDVTILPPSRIDRC